MCIAKIKQILFPTNIFGKDKKSIKIDLPSGWDSVELYVQWEGERMDVAYTRIWTPGPKEYRNGESNRVTLTDGDGGVEQIDIVRVNTGRQRIACHEVYFNCTNVTQLIINGTQYI